MKIVGYIFSFSFLALLLIPLTFADPVGGAISNQENRVLAVRPSIQGIFSHPGDYITQLDSWISDNIGFRENLIYAYKSMLGYLENQVQYSDGHLTYLIGENGHRFFSGPSGRSMIPKFQGKMIFNDAELKGFSDDVKRIKNFLDRKKIPFVMMLCIDKETVYPEYYPKSIHRGSEPDLIDTITEYIKGSSGVDVFNLKQRFLSEKEKYPLFNRAVGDLTHYNEIGGFFAYCELFLHLHYYFPDLLPVTLDDISIVYEGSEIPLIALNRPATYRKLPPEFFDNIDLLRPFTWENAAFENIDATKPTILFFRDSYSGDGNFFSRYIPEHFGKTILIHYSNLKNFKHYIDLYHPDIVVFESAERDLQLFFDSIASVPSDVF